MSSVLINSWRCAIHNKLLFHGICYRDNNGFCSHGSINTEVSTIILSQQSTIFHHTDSHGETLEHILVLY